MMGLKDTFAYRFNLFFLVVKEVFIALTFIFLWSSVASSDLSKAGSSLSILITYYLAISFLQLFATEDTAWQVTDNIENGNLVNFLLRPLNVFFYFFFVSLGFRLGRALILLPVYMLAFFLFSHYGFLSGIGFLYFIPFFALSFFLSFLIHFVLGCVAFFTESAWGFILAWIFLGGFLGGRLMPVSFFPLWLRYISDYLPFQYLYYIPAAVLTGDFSRLFFWFALMFLWCGIFFSVAIGLWRYGTGKFEGYGR